MSSIPVDPCCPSIVDGVVSPEEAEELADLFKVVADPVRVRLLSAVMASESGEICACDLPDLLDRSQPTISHHLSLMVDRGILAREQRGRWAWFRVRADRLDALARALGQA